MNDTVYRLVILRPSFRHLPFLMSKHHRNIIYFAHLLGIDIFLFSFFLSFHSKIFLSDPDADEEDLSSTLISVAVCNGEICLLHKPGGCALSPSQIEQCIKLAHKREQSVCKLISSVTNDAKKMEM